MATPLPKTAIDTAVAPTTAALRTMSLFTCDRPPDLCDVVCVSTGYTRTLRLAEYTPTRSLPDEERTSLLELILTTLGGADDSDAGPFRLLSWDDARGFASDGRLTLYPHTVT
jgi:hypothetical protein